MQMPNAKTPIKKCEHLSLHAQTMLKKFSSVAALGGLADKLGEATAALVTAQSAYAAAVTTLVVLRVEVKYADFTADEGVRMAIRVADLADGKAGGRISSHLFPGGVTPIIKPVGDTQIVAMRALETRYDDVASSFPAAADEKQKLVMLRTQYETALTARKAGMETASNLRAARNLAKEDYLDVYNEAASRVRAAFPRDRRMQELFFDKVRADSEVEEVEEDVEDPAEPPAAQPPA